jgi:hypothetical protein
MFVGPSGTGKHKFAMSVEKALFERGMAAYMLDGTNVLLGVDADLVFKESTQNELVRRFAEVAHILLDAGHLVVSTTNSIGLADVAAVQALVSDFFSLLSFTRGRGKFRKPPPVSVSPAGLLDKLECIHGPCSVAMKGGSMKRNFLIKALSAVVLMGVLAGCAMGGPATRAPQTNGPGANGNSVPSGY